MSHMLAPLEGRRYRSYTRREWAVFLFGADEFSRRHSWTRRYRWRSMLSWLRWEFHVATRLPGDTLQAIDSDSVWLIHGGRPGHLRGWCIPGRLIARCGADGDLWPLVAHNPPESWLANLQRVRL